MFSVKRIFDNAVIPQGEILPCAIEQFAAKDFFENACGWTRNDIAVLAATTSKAQYDAIVQRLVERKAEFNLKPDTPVVDAYKVITPRWCQSPNEIQEFAEYAANLQLSDIDKQYETMRPDEQEQKSESVESSE